MASETMLIESAERLFSRHITPEVLRAPDAWHASAWDAVEEAGLIRALVPEHAGGFGVPVQEALDLLRVAGAHSAPLPLGETMLGLWLLARAGITLPAGPVTLADADDTGRTPWARHARWLVLLHHDHLELYAASTWRTTHGANLAGESRDTVEILGAPAARAPIDLTPGALRAAGAVVRTQQIAGALTRITSMTVSYAQQRVQFGRPIGRFQAVQQSLAVLASQTAAALAAADLAADAFADGLRIPTIAAAKARAGEAAGIAAATAHQIHGAIGFTQEHALHHLTRRLWSWRDEFGGEREWQTLLGEIVATHGADQLWATITTQ